MEQLSQKSLDVNKLNTLESIQIEALGQAIKQMWARPIIPNTPKPVQGFTVLDWADDFNRFYGGLWLSLDNNLFKILSNKTGLTRAKIDKYLNHLIEQRLVLTFVDEQTGALYVKHVHWSGRPPVTETKYKDVLVGGKRNMETAR